MQAQPSLKPDTANPGSAGIAGHSRQRGVPGRAARLGCHTRWGAMAFLAPFHESVEKTED